MNAPAAPSPAATTRNTFATSDATTLSYLEAGAGRTLVLLPGWSQSAAEFSKQIEYFARHHRVVALDHRGQGESEKTTTGLRITRLAADLHELLVHLQLNDVALLGHSMGCAVIWSYWDQFGGSRIGQLVLVDQPAAMAYTPLWAERDVELVGAPLGVDDVFQIATAVAGPAGQRVSAGILATMSDPALAPQDKTWITSENFKTPRFGAAQLFVDEALGDWRDVIPTITVPTLVTAGESSIYPVAGPRWVADHIPGACLRVFTADEHGSHLVFWQNDTLFNDEVLRFLTRRR